jgi:hypothetical protein
MEPGRCSGMPSRCRPGAGGRFRIGANPNHVLLRTRRPAPHALRDWTGHGVRVYGCGVEKEMAATEQECWKLLKTAIVFGETRESRRILDLHNGEEAIQRMVTTPPGKNAGEGSEAIERMIQSYAFDKGASPTALQLLRWLGSDRTGHSDAPLKVDHPLWTDAIPRVVKWPQFQQLVKDAKKRMKR